jgi:hypothetical protein
MHQVWAFFRVIDRERTARRSSTFQVLNLR